MRARDDWKPQRPEGFCEECELPLTKMVAVDVGDRWSLYWDCPNLCGSVLDDFIDIDWPFSKGEVASADDLRELGFTVL